MRKRDSVRVVLSILFCTVFLFVFASCDNNDSTGPDDNQNQNSNTITGTVHLPDSLAGYKVCIGTLEGWLDFWTNVDDTTLMKLSYSYGGTGPIDVDHVVVLEAGEAERTFTYEMPEADYEHVDFVVAWVDRNEDQDIATVDDGSGHLLIAEQSRFPLKEYESATHVIDTWGYVAYGAEVEFLVYINNENLGLSIVGTSGFNFFFK